MAIRNLSPDDMNYSNFPADSKNPSHMKALDKIARDIAEPVGELFAAYNRKVEPLKQQIAENNRKLVEIKQKRDENNHKLDENNHKLDENNCIIESVRAERMLEEKKLQELNKKEQSLLTEDFDSIFREMKISDQGKPILIAKSTLSSEQNNQLFTAYLKQDSTQEKAALTAEKVKINGKTIGFCQINSMRPIIDYLKDHSNVKVCDFRNFKDKVFDVSTLANYVANPTCSVVSIIISKSISQSDMQILAQARAARQNRLNIQFA